MGELGLDGNLQPIKGALPMAIKAREAGFEGMIVPVANVDEAAVVNRLKVYGANNLSEVIGFLNGVTEINPTEVDTRGEFARAVDLFDLDFSEV